MQRRTFLACALSLAGAAGVVIAQEKAQKLTGHVDDINKDKMMIIMHTKGSRVPRNIVYDASTKFMLDGKDAGADAVKSNYRIVAQGKFEDKNLKASRIELFTR